MASGAICFHGVQVAAVLPWATTHHHQTRCYAHVLLHSILQHFTPGSAACWAHSGHHCTAILQSIKGFTSSNPHAAKLVASAKLALQPEFAQVGSLRVLLAGQVALAGSHEAVLESAPESLLDRIDSLLLAERHSKRSAAAAPPATMEAINAPAFTEAQAATYQRKPQALQSVQRARHPEAALMWATGGLAPLATDVCAPDGAAGVGCSLGWVLIDAHEKRRRSAPRRCFCTLPSAHCTPVLTTGMVPAQADCTCTSKHSQRRALPLI